MNILNENLDLSYRNKLFVFRHADKSKTHTFDGFGKTYGGMSPLGELETKALAAKLALHLGKSDKPVNLVVEYNPVTRTKSLADYIVETTKRIKTIPIEVSFEENSLLADDLWDSIYDDYVDSLCDAPGTHDLAIGKNAVALGLFLGLNDFNKPVYRSAVKGSIANFDKFVSTHNNFLKREGSYNVVVGTSNSVVMDWYLLSKLPELQKGNFTIINTVESFKVEDNWLFYRGLSSKI